MFKRLISAILSFFMMLSNMLFSDVANNDELRIVVPENWELLVGDSRTVECVFDEKITERKLEWSVEPADVASVDKWGRVTALKAGEATVTAKGNGFEDSVQLNVVTTPTMMSVQNKTVMYGHEPVEQVDNLQKIVTRYANGDPNVPEFVTSITNYGCYKSAVTADGAVWQIMPYGVLRTDKNAPTERDIEQRFMGDRYFYSNDTSRVRAILPDGKNGIWTVMDNGYTHIEMVEMSGTEKATLMSAETQQKVDRYGMTDAGYQSGDSWVAYEDDNDGLWTSMYGGGELMRYAAVRDDPNASPEEVEAAKQAAYRSAEAVLMLYYISMRSGTTEAYVRYQTNENVPSSKEDRWLSANALEAGGDPSFMVPQKSPSQLYKESALSFALFGSAKKYRTEGFYYPVSADSWSNPAENPDIEYEKQTRLLEGFPVRTYSLSTEDFTPSGTIHWEINSDGTATGVSTKTPDSGEYLVNNENLRGVTIDASKQVPERLWNDLLGSEVTPDMVTYKTDTSADELVGHMFIFKLINDIIAPEDPEIKAILVEAVDSLAQHLSDNSYMLCDGTGQPTSWGNFGRTVYCAGTSVAQSPLHALVLLNIFKTAAYITGYQKWEDEYRMAALDPAYEYAEVVSQYKERMFAAIELTVANETIPLLGSVIDKLKNTNLMESLYRLVINYSDEEMAMLGFYTIFGMETDEELLEIYRSAIDDWWVSIKYSQNPLWYYVYQLAYPNKTVTDAYGNDIVELAAWSLSRHPANTMMYCASNKNRDDIAELDLSVIGIKTDSTLTYNKLTSKPLPNVSQDAPITDPISFVLTALNLDWDVAPPDERSVYKYNTNSYTLTRWHLPYCTQASTTYTLPYWMGVYHGMLEK